MFLIRGYGFALAMGVYFLGMFAALCLYGGGLDERGQVKLIFCAHALLTVLDMVLLMWLNRRGVKHTVCGAPAQFFMIALGLITAGVLRWAFRGVFA